MGSISLPILYALLHQNHFKSIVIKKITKFAIHRLQSSVTVSPRPHRMFQIYGMTSRGQVVTLFTRFPYSTAASIRRESTANLQEYAAPSTVIVVDAGPSKGIAGEGLGSHEREDFRLFEVFREPPILRETRPVPVFLLCIGVETLTIVGIPGFPLCSQIREGPSLISFFWCKKNQVFTCFACFQIPILTQITKLTDNVHKYNFLIDWVGEPNRT